MAITLAEGCYFITDVEQTGSRVYLIVFRKDDPGERLSLAHTRIAQGHLFLGPMSNLISNRRGILARICEDDVRTHNILSSTGADVTFPSTLIDKLEEHGIPGWSLPDGVDFFTPVTVADARLSIGPSPARPGDRLALLMAMDVVCAMVVREGAVKLTVRDKMVPYGADRHG